MSTTVDTDIAGAIPLADLIRRRLDALRLPPDLRPGEPMRSWRSIAESLGVSAQYLTDVYNGRYPPGRKILRALGIRKVEYGVVDSAADASGDARHRIAELERKE